VIVEQQLIWFTTNLLPILITVFSLSCIGVWCLDYFTQSKSPVSHSKKNITSKRCFICGGPNRGYRECGICQKAKEIINLEDLREWNDKQILPTKEESLVKAVNFYQERDYVSPKPQPSESATFFIKPKPVMRFTPQLIGQMNHHPEWFQPAERGKINMVDWCKQMDYRLSAEP
jgi:hypothetical protein